MKPKLIVNPRLHWAVDVGHQSTIAYIDGMAATGVAVPREGQVLTLPFMVDPITRQPCPVRVLRLQYQQDQVGTVIVPVVVRAHQD